MIILKMNFQYISNVFVLIGSWASAKTHLCDEGWSKHGINCFKVFTFYGPYGGESFASANESKSRCEAYGANLTSIHGDNENKFVNDLVIKSYNQCQKDNVPWCCDSYIHDGYWIGMTLTRAKNGTILHAEWSDRSNTNYGNPVKKVDQTAWYTQPSQANSDNNCVLILLTNSGIGWVDYVCDAAKIGGFVCKKKVKKTV